MKFHARDMQFRSEVGQDRFVFAMLGHRGPGTFLDIGCGDPVVCNNTYALEQAGWDGILIDNDPKFIAACKEKRTATAIQLDATDPRMSLVRDCDYLSLDVDDATLSALKVIMSGDATFKVITIEHDYYRVGEGARDLMREILFDAGYLLAVADVRCGGGIFEDWWISREILNP